MDVRILKEFVDASEPNEINIARHINHSCDPNAVVELWEDPSGQNRALVISKRAISPGEEITINYGRDFKPSPCGSSSSWAGKTLNNETSTAHDDPDGLTLTDDPKVRDGIQDSQIYKCRPGGTSCEVGPIATTILLVYAASISVAFRRIKSKAGCDEWMNQWHQESLLLALSYSSLCPLSFSAFPIEHCCCSRRTIPRVLVPQASAEPSPATLAHHTDPTALHIHNNEIFDLTWPSPSSYTWLLMAQSRRGGSSRNVLASARIMDSNNAEAPTADQQRALAAKPVLMLIKTIA
ncbi:hypothetical protein B0H13DRAFT_1854855 [Mycena leptocephala]|nr:hypothetical protein B0H13DRAFT_1854855 [Mycena leptocephala]